MRKYSIGFFAIVCLIGGCVKDAEIKPKQYPLVTTNSVEDINSKGATFSAVILDFGQEEIIDYGFTWSGTEAIYKNSLYKKDSIVDFSVRISADLAIGKSYVCKAYVKTARNLVVGNPVTFISQGSAVPKIHNFYPKEGYDGTLIKLTGDNFSQILTNNKVLVDNIAAVLISLNGDTITFKTPLMGFIGDATISVEVGSQKTTSDYKFKVLGPEINAVSSLSGYSGANIIIDGKSFTQNGLNTEVYFGRYKAEILSLFENKLDIIVPTPIFDLLNDQPYVLKIVNGLKSIVYKELFVIKHSWESKQPTPFDSWSWKHQAFTYGDKGYIFEIDQKMLFVYNPIYNQWNSIPASLFSRDRNEGSLYLVSSDQLFKAGGYNYMNELLDELWAYSFVNSTWVRKDKIPFKFLEAIHFTLNSQIYVITNEGQLWKCNFENGQYIKLKNCPVDFTRSFASTFMCNGKAFVVTYGKTLQYNDENDSWIEKSSNQIVHINYSINAKGFSYNNTGYVLQAGRDLYKYDAMNDKWILTSIYPGCGGENAYKAVFTLGNKAYFAAISSNSWGCAPLMYSYQGY